MTKTRKTSRNKKFTRSKKLKSNRSRKGGFWGRLFGFYPDSNNNKSWFRWFTGKKTMKELEDIYNKCVNKQIVDDIKCSKTKDELLAEKKKELSYAKDFKIKNEDILRHFDKDSNSGIAAQENIDEYELKIKELERDIASIEATEDGDGI